MIKYTTKDIVKRAEQLADLENSDFISDFEKSALINESWVELYQKIVNANDKTFIKTTYAVNGMTLPRDFFQLCSLYVEKNKEQILKYNASQKNGYEIKNNTLYLSQAYEDVEVIMEYYPVPQTLFYSSGKRESVQYSYNPKIIIDNDFFIDTNNNIVEKGLGVIGTTSTAGLKLANGVISTDGKFTDYNGNLIEERTDKPFIVKGNTVTYDDVTGEGISDYLMYITDEAEEVGYFVDKTLQIYTMDKEFTDYSLSENSLIYCRADGLYFTTSAANKISRLLGKVCEVFALGLGSFCAFINERDCVIKINDNYYKTTYGFNSFLNYPNNIYYTMLEYMLAISFKMKQQGDIQVLSAKQQEVFNQFLDSLSRDANTFYTMKNVYSTGNRNLW